MHTSAHLSLVWLLGGVFLGVVAIPMILGWVPPNGLYGFRTPKTMSSAEIWYPANRYAGLALLIAGLVITTGAAVLRSFAGSLPVDTVAWLGLGLVMVPLLAATLLSMLYLRRL